MKRLMVALVVGIVFAGLVGNVLAQAEYAEFRTGNRIDVLKELNLPATSILKIAGTAVTPSAAELNLLKGATGLIVTNSSYQTFTGPTLVSATNTGTTVAANLSASGWLTAAGVVTGASFKATGAYVTNQFVTSVVLVSETQANFVTRGFITQGNVYYGLTGSTTNVSTY